MPKAQTPPTKPGPAKAYPHHAPTTPIHPVYTFYHLILEPLFALSGSLQLLLSPATFFAYMPLSTPYVASPPARLLANQLAAAYLLVALVEALVLRAARNDVKIWTAVLWALVVCDGGHVYASWVEMGTWAFFRPWVWGMRDGIGMGLTLGPLIMRACFLLGVGVRGG